jgi:hypothetical protein
MIRRGHRRQREHVYSQLEQRGVAEPVRRLQETVDLLKLPTTNRTQKEGGGRSSRQPRAIPRKAQRNQAFKILRKSLRKSYWQDSRVQTLKQPDKALARRNEKRAQAIAGLVNRKAK